MSDIYKISVVIAAVNQMSPIMAIIAKDALGLQRRVDEISRGFNAWKGGLVAVAGVLAAGEIVKGLVNIAQHGEKLLDQQDKLQRAGLAYADVLRLQGDYYEKIAKQVPTSTASGYLKTYNELRSVVGQDKAEAVTPWAMKLESLIANTTGKSAEGEGFKLWRAMEMTGRSMSDPAGTQKLADSLAKNIIGSGGKLDAGTFQTMAKRAGVAWANADPKFLAGPMSVVGADLGGDTAGTALMSSYMFLTGANTLSKQQYAVLEKAGLIDKSVKATMDLGGRYNLPPGAIVGSKEFAANGHFDLYGWTTKILKPALEKLSKGDRGVADSLIAKLGRNRNVMRMLNMFYDPGFQEQIAKDLEQWEKAHSIDQSYGEAMQRNPLFVKKAFHEQYESMLQAMGAPMMQAALPVMRSVTELFTEIGRVTNRNSGNITAVIDIVKQLGSAIYAIDSFIVQKLGAITGLSSLFRLLSDIPWEKLRDGLAGVNGAIMNVFSGLGDAILNALKTELAKVIGGIKGLLPGLGSSPQQEPGGHMKNNPFMWQQRFDPGTGKTERQQYAFSLNIDGERVAQAIIDKLEARSRFPTNTPAFNGLA